MEDQGNSNSNGSSTGSEKGSGTRITRSQRGGGSSGGGGGNSSSAEESTTGKDSFRLSVTIFGKALFLVFSINKYRRGDIVSLEIPHCLKDQYCHCTC